MTLRPRDKAALGVVAVLATIAAFYMLVLAPVRHTASKLTASIASTQSALTQDQSVYNAGRAAKASLTADRAEWAALDRAVPANANVPAMLRVIQREAQAAGVAVQTISMGGGSGASSGSTSTGSATSSSSTGGSQATAVPVSLTFIGGYQGLNRLIGRLDSLVEVRRGTVRASGPLMSIANVDFSGSASKITAQLSATIYQLDPASTGGTA